jgi:hypothetical protein
VKAPVAVVPLPPSSGVCGVRKPLATGGPVTASGDTKLPGGGDAGPISVDTVAGTYVLDHDIQTGGGSSAKLPAVAARFGSGSALFEYQETIPSSCEVRGSVLFEYQMLGWP